MFWQELPGVETMRQRYRICACLIAFAIWSCRVHPPDRLPGISPSATWVGWIDGGAWIECSLELGSRSNWCTVWDDQLGHVISRTEYVLRNSGLPAPVEALVYRSFDGVDIELLDGEVLEPLAFYLTVEEDLPPPPIDPPRNRPPG